MKTEKFTLPPDFVDFLKLMQKHQVRYLVIGSWAVALHGRPRYTKDIDILVAREPENARKIMLVINEFGFGSVGLSAEDFMREHYVVQLGFEPNRIDILTHIDGVQFEEAEQRKHNILVGEVSLPVISILDLLKAKQAASRPQDLADIDQLNRLLSLRGKKKD